jgi:hypothetical protein
MQAAVGALLLTVGKSKTEISTTVPPVSGPILYAASLN